MEEKIQLLEKKIADFKETYSESLPELLPYNLSMVEKLQQELVVGQNQIISLKDQILTMNLELANFDILVSQKTGPLSVPQQLAQAKGNLASLKDKYSEHHPDVKRLKRLVESLEDELKTKNITNNGEPKNEYRSPLFLKLSSQIRSTEREIKRLLKRQKQAKEELATFEKRVADTHQVKRAYSDLVRDYDNNVSKYKELRAKELQAELAQNLESENKGESFTLIEPPSLPSKPEKPNRFKIFLMGFAASFGIGVGLALLYEMLMGGVRGYNDISKIFGSPPLVVVPVLNTAGEIKKTTINRHIKVYWLIGITTILILVFHFLVMDVHILWFKFMRAISLV